MSCTGITSESQPKSCDSKESGLLVCCLEQEGVGDCRQESFKSDLPFEREGAFASSEDENEMRCEAEAIGSEELLSRDSVSGVFDFCEGVGDET